MKHHNVILIGLCLCIVSLAQAASFDCNKAQTKVETLICTFPQLSEADEQLGNVYAQALKALPTTPASQLREEQRDWLEERDKFLTMSCMDQTCLTENQTFNACFKVDCAVQFYTQRINTLAGDTFEPVDHLLLAASFDCTKASTQVERLICANPRLSDADGRLGQAYTELKASLAKMDRDALQKEQRAWLQKRDTQLVNCGNDINCAIETYEDRIAMLDVQLDAETYNLADTATVIGHYSMRESMSLQVKPLVKDHVLIEIEGAEPTAGKWLCHFSGVGTLTTENTVQICHADRHTPILFTFSKNGVEVSGEYLDYFCGMGGTISGQYRKLDH